MSSETDVVRAIRIPSELHARIKTWAEAQSPQVTINAALRHLLERGMTEIERKRVQPKT